MRHFAIAVALISVSLLGFAGDASAANRQDQIVMRLVQMCHHIASINDDEARYWISGASSEVAQKKLSNRAGQKAISRALAKTSDPFDRACLKQIQQDAITHSEVVP